MREANREKKTATRNKTIRMTLSALHSMCSIYLLHFIPIFFLSFLMKKIQLQPTECDKEAQEQQQ